jgi:WD40 repeat protein/tRNA A-37 threonylcarbamoyl transferase component Bud32
MSEERAERPGPETVPTDGPAPSGSPLQARLLSELLVRWEEAWAQGQVVSAEELCRDRPELLKGLKRQIAALQPAPVPAGGAPAGGFPSVPGYEVLGELGHGGMGVVFKARHLTLNRLVALKMIRAGALASPQERARFLQEAEAVARLQHPQIVQIYEVGAWGDHPFFSLELLERGSLAGRLDGTPQPAAAAARLVESLARAVEHAHQRGVIHRDLKPANVLLAEDGSPKVTDFGLARFLDDAAGKTLTGQVMGTPSYMAPEQAAGKARDVGPHTDVYALGAILYELLTGRPPFLGASHLETLAQVEDVEPVPPSRLNPKAPGDLETICLKCLRKEPRRRYASAQALADDLRRFQEGRPILARPVGPGERLVKWARRRPWAVGLGALAVAVAAVGLGLVLWQWQAARSAQAWAERERDDKEGERVKARAAEGEARGLALREAKARDEEAQARGKEGAARKRAESARLRSDTALYANLLLRAQQAWRDNNPVLAEQLLEECRWDLRHWEWGFLKRLCETSPLTLRGHHRAVYLVAFRPDGKQVVSVSGSGLGTVKAWDVATGQEALNHHFGSFTRAALSPDGTRLALFGSPDQPGRKWALRVHDLASGRPLYTCVGHARQDDRPGFSLAFSPDGKWLASAVYDQNRPGPTVEVKVWDAATGKEARSLGGHPGAVSHLAFSPDGKRLAGAGGPAEDSRAATVWEVATGKVALVLGEHRHLGPLAVAPDGKSLATLGAREVKVWDAHTGKEVRTLALARHRQECLVFSPDSRRLAAGGEVVKVWDLETGQELLALGASPSSYSCAAFNPDGRRLALGCQDGTVRVWEGPAALPAVVEPVPDVVWAEGRISFASDSRQLFLNRVHNPSTWGLRPGTLKKRLPWTSRPWETIGPDGRWLVQRHKGNQLQLLDVSTGRPLVLEHPQQLRDVTFSPDGRLLAGAGVGGLIKVWGLPRGAELGSLEASLRSPAVLTFSADSRLLATAGPDGAVTLWQAPRGKELGRLPGHVNPSALTFSPSAPLLAVSGAEGKVWDVRARRERFSFPGAGATAFSPDGKRLAAPLHDGTLGLWDVTTGVKLLSVPAHVGKVGARASAFSPDGRLLASLGANEKGKGELRLWEAPLPVSYPFTVRAAGVANPAFSPDGKLLAGGDQREVLVWNSRTGERVFRCRGHSRRVLGVAFGPRSRRLATAGEDRTIKVWALNEEQEGATCELTLTGHTGPVRAVAFHPGGRLLASAGDSTVRVWGLETGKEEFSLSGHEGAVLHVAFSRDGGLLGSVGADGTARVWDVASRKEKAVTMLSARPARYLAFHPDGKRLVLAGRAGVVVWEPATGRTVRAFEGNTACLSPDGRRLATGRISKQGDLILRVRGLATGQQERVLRGHVAPVWHLTFSPDGRRLASVGRDTIRLWDLGPPGPEAP